MHDQERILLILPGWANQNKHNVIYEFMLKHLDVSAKFELVMKLTKYTLYNQEECVLKDIHN